MSSSMTVRVDRQGHTAIVLGLVAAFVTAGAVSWSTPDGNLVVTLVPALIVGLIVFGIAVGARSTENAPCS